MQQNRPKLLVRGALAALLFLAPLAAQSPTVVTRMDFRRANGGPYETYYQAVPTTLTTVETKDARLLGYCVYNSTGAAVSFTIQTNDSTPLPLPLTGSVASGSSVCNNAPFGILSRNGFGVQAAAAGLYYAAVWTH